MHTFEMLERLNEAGLKTYQVRFYKDCTHIYTEAKSIPSTLIARLTYICPFDIVSDICNNQPSQKIILSHED